MDDFPTEAPGDPPDFLSGGGAMGALMRAHPWRDTPLGPPETWPQSLRTSVSTCLNCSFPILIWWGPELVKLYNDAYTVILGEKHPEALGSPGRKVWPEIWDVIGPMLDRVLRRGEATPADDLFLALRRHGYDEECYFSFSYSPIRDESGGVGGVFCPVIETTERVVGERRLRLLRLLGARTAGLGSPEEVCAAAADCIAQEGARDLPFAAIYLADADAAGTVRLAATSNEAGLFPATLHGGAEGAWPFEAALHEGEALIDHGGLSRLLPEIPNGPWRDPPQSALVLPLRGATLPGFLTVGLNPHRPVAEMTGFARLVAAQIATALANADAYRAERRRAEALAEIDRAKTAFFSNVSHEFRTPLTLILGPLEQALGRAETLPPGLEAELELVQRNALRLRKLVNTLLDFARIEAGRARAVFVPTPLSQFTADLASGFRSACERAGIALIVECPPLPEPVHVDRGMWEKIVLNLLSNALKFTFAGQIAVHLSHQGDRAVLRVEDSGVGIPAGELPHVFERFHRIAGQAARTHEGSGIGLALVQDLVRLHGGEISAESEEGRGTAITIRLRFGTAHLDSQQVAPAPEQEEGTRPALVESFVQEALGWLSNDTGEGAAPPAGVDGDQPARILLADDNADMRAYVSRLLGQWWQVEAVADGEAALRSVRSQRPDLVLADVMMPRLDGFGLLRAIRADPAVRDLPVILLSARAGEEARLAGLEAGADDYIPKPFSADELRARVHANLVVAELRRKTMQSALDDAERLRRMFHLAPGFMAVLRGPEHVFELVNAAYIQLVGNRELIGRSVRDAFPDVADQPFLKMLDQVYRTGKPLTGQSVSLLLEREPGAPRERRFIDFVYQPIPDANGAVTGIFVEGSDVTERVHALGALEQLNRELEQRVAERSEELLRANEQLRQAQKMEAIGQLTGGIAHDFNNLLTAIRGGLELIRRRVAQGRTSDLERYLDAAQTAADRGAALTHRLLAFARRQALSPKPVNPATLIAGMLDLISRTAGPSVKVEPQLEAPDAVVVCDPNQLESALLNLAINARDAMPAGGRLQLRVHTVELAAADLAGFEGAAPGTYVEIAVGDTGTGMPPDVAARAFEPFFTTKPAGQGTGLGLSQIYGFARQSEGAVRLESAVGKGTKVRLLLPLRDAKPDQAQPLPGREATEARAVSGHVLLVEDEPEVRHLAAEVLREIGCTVLEAADADGALGLLGGTPRLDLLVTDVGLPGGMNGRQLADAIRELHPELPVLFITGYAGPALAEWNLSPGMEVIAKPYSLTDFSQRVRTLLATAPAATRQEEARA